MGNFTDAMQNLVGEINTSADRRRVELSDLIKGFHQERRDRSQELKKQLGEIASDINQAGRIWREGFKKKSLRKS